MPKTKVIEISLVDTAGHPIGGVTARLTLSGRAGTFLTAKTGRDGNVTFDIPETTKGARVELSPIGGHWSIGRDWKLSGNSRLELRAVELPRANNGLGWWHNKMGVKASDATGGAGVRVGIIDTGCGPHPALSHVQPVGTFTDGKRALPGIEDEAEHGTHVCGIIAARVNSPTEFCGIAPATDLFVARVYKPGVTINQADIANAIDALVHERVHLINISLGASIPSRPLNESIENAWLHGAVCFASAGNSSGDVLWPGRHERVVAVTALGSSDDVPAESLGRLLLEGCSAPDGIFGLVFPAFSARGPQVGCCAPGVGIISTIRWAGSPSKAWGDLSGTSMASPLALGLISVLLGKEQKILKMNADEKRSESVFALLLEHCAASDLDQDQQGNGLPVLDLASAVA